MSRVIFLGTAADTSVLSRNLRSSGGIIVEYDGVQLHIDPGPGALVRAAQYGLNLRNTTGILVTNSGLNQCNDVNVLIESMTYSGLEQRGVLVAGKSVLTGSQEEYPIVSKRHQSLVEKTVVLEKNSKVGVDIVEIHSLPVTNIDKTAVGFKLFFPRYVLSYTGETGYSEELVDALSGTDVLVLAVQKPANKGNSLQLDCEQAIRIISKVRPKLAVLTHFSAEILKADVLSETRDIQRVTGVQTIAAKDGLVVVPENYRSTLQSPVKGFH